MKDTFKAFSKEGKELINSDNPLHPGSIIKEEIEAKGLRKIDVANSLGIKPSNLSELLRGKRNVSAKVALKLERLFGVDADFWLRVQNAYDLVKARKKSNF